MPVKSTPYPRSSADNARPGRSIPRVPVGGRTSPPNQPSVGPNRGPLQAAPSNRGGRPTRGPVEGGRPSSQPGGPSAEPGGPTWTTMPYPMPKPTTPPKWPKGSQQIPGGSPRGGRPLPGRGGTMPSKPPKGSGDWKPDRGGWNPKAPAPVPPGRGKRPNPVEGGKPRNTPPPTPKIPGKPKQGPDKIFKMPGKVPPGKGGGYIDKIKDAMGPKPKTRGVPDRAPSRTGGPAADARAAMAKRIKGRGKGKEK